MFQFAVAINGSASPSIRYRTESFWNAHGTQIVLCGDFQSEGDFRQLALPDLQFQIGFRSAHQQYHFPGFVWPCSRKRTYQFTGSTTTVVVDV